MDEHLNNIYLQIACDLEEHFHKQPKSHEGLTELILGPQSMGWIEIGLLQQYIEEYEHFPANATVQLFHEDAPSPIFEHPLFQRRKVGEIIQIGPEKTFHLLINGEKIGPFNTEKLKEKLKKREILHTCSASNDHGKTWHKLYEFKSFDRRYLDQENLPAKPNKDIFNSSLSEVQSALNEESESRQKQDAIAGLAHFGQIKSAQKPRPIEEDQSSELEDQHSSQNHLLKVIMAVVTVVLVIGIWHFGSSKSPSPLLSKQKKTYQRKIKKRSLNNSSQAANKIKKQKIRKKNPPKTSYKTRAPRTRRAVSSKRRNNRFNSANSIKSSRKKMRDNPLIEDESDDYRNREDNNDRKLSKEYFKKDRPRQSNNSRRGDRDRDGQDDGTNEYRDNDINDEDRADYSDDLEQQDLDNSRGDDDDSEDREREEFETDEAAEEDFSE